MVSVDGLDFATDLEIVTCICSDTNDFYLEEMIKVGCLKKAGVHSLFQIAKYKQNRCIEELKVGECAGTDPEFLKRGGAPKSRTDRTLSLVGTGVSEGQQQRRNVIFTIRCFCALSTPTQSQAPYLCKK